MRSLAAFCNSKCIVIADDTARCKMVSTALAMIKWQKMRIFSEHHLISMTSNGAKARQLITLMRNRSLRSRIAGSPGLLTYRVSPKARTMMSTRSHKLRRHSPRRPSLIIKNNLMDWWRKKSWSNSSTKRRTLTLVISCNIRFQSSVRIRSTNFSWLAAMTCRFHQKKHHSKSSKSRSTRLVSIVKLTWRTWWLDQSLRTCCQCGSCQSSLTSHICYYRRIIWAMKELKGWLRRSPWVSLLSLSTSLRMVSRLRSAKGFNTYCATTSRWSNSISARLRAPIATD